MFLKSTASDQEKKAQDEKIFTHAFDGSPIPTFIIDREHKIILFNRACENLTGIASSDMIGTCNQWKAFYSRKRLVLADLIVDCAPEKKIQKNYKQGVKKSKLIEGAYEVEGFFSDFGDSGKWLFFTAAPLKDKDGNVVGAIETLQDVTDRKRAEFAKRESDIRYKALLDITPYPIVVFSTEGIVLYLNPAFTDIFGWTIEELQGKIIPFTPPDLEEETRVAIRNLLKTNVILRKETRRLTKDGRTLDVVIRASAFYLAKNELAGYLVFLRDITQQNRIERNNAAILRISTALPEYIILEELMDYISGEIKELLNSEGALVILPDYEREELYFLGAAYDDDTIQNRVKEIRFPLDQLVAGEVIKSGKPMMVSGDLSEESPYHERDKKLGYQTRSLIQVPLKSSGSIIGVLCAINKKEGDFDDMDVELLNMISGKVALSIENAKYSDELKTAYQEVSSLNRAKDKVINHLSHEMRTPVAITLSLFGIINDKLKGLSDGSADGSANESVQSLIIKIEQNLKRIVEIQNEAADIIRSKTDRAYNLMTRLLDQCADTIDAIATEKGMEGAYAKVIRARVEEIFGVKKDIPEKISLRDFVDRRIDFAKSIPHNRGVVIKTSLESGSQVFMPPEPLEKIIDGLIKNAIENTPDQGLIEIISQKKGNGTELRVHDFGVGIIEDYKRRIFEGFFVTQDVLKYSSKTPYAFNAGGKGADLLRMKIFSERYGFKIDMVSTRCHALPTPKEVCPGIINQCPICSETSDCFTSGETVFTLFFPSP